MKDNTVEVERADPTEVAWRGIDSCRRGDWQEGLYWLSLATDSNPVAQELPSLYFAYLGYGMARNQGQEQEGARLCRRAIELEFHEPENYYCLAKVCLLMNDRRAAVDAIDRGLEIDSAYRELVELKQRLGMRRAPVLPFLPRQSFLNRALGKIRHQLLEGMSPNQRSR